MADPGTILDILQFVGVAASAVNDAIDNAPKAQHEERQALKELRKGVEILKSDISAYKVVLNAMENDADDNGRSAYTRFIQRYVLGLWSTSYAHMATIYGITDRMECKQWKASKGRSRPRGYFWRKFQRAKPR